MVSATSALVAIVSIVGLLQMFPAPPIAAGAAAAAAAGAVQLGKDLLIDHVKGKMESAVSGRAISPDVSQESIDMCTAAINKQHDEGGAVKISELSEDSILVTSLPKPCMDLASVLAGRPAREGGPNASDLGIDSIQYTNLSAEDRCRLAAVLGVQDSADR